MIVYLHFNFCFVARLFYLLLFPISYTWVRAISYNYMHTYTHRQPEEMEREKRKIFENINEMFVEGIRHLSKRRVAFGITHKKWSINFSFIRSLLLFYVQHMCWCDTKQYVPGTRSSRSREQTMSQACVYWTINLLQCSINSVLISKPECIWFIVLRTKLISSPMNQMIKGKILIKCHSKRILIDFAYTIGVHSKTNHHWQATNEPNNKCQR